MACSGANLRSASTECEWNHLRCSPREPRSLLYSSRKSTSKYKGCFGSRKSSGPRTSPTAKSAGPFHSESGHRAERRRQSTYFHFIRRSSSSESGVFCLLVLASDSRRLIKMFASSMEHGLGIIPGQYPLAASALKNTFHLVCPTMFRIGSILFIW